MRIWNQIFAEDPIERHAGYQRPSTQPYFEPYKTIQLHTIKRTISQETVMYVTRLVPFIWCDDFL